MRKPPLYDEMALANLPDPEWLVEGFLPHQSVVVMFGAMGSYKSFIAVDWACHVAQSTPWQNHSVRGGPVVYIAGEGHIGLRKRLAAWRERAGLETNTLHGVWTYPEAVNFLKAGEVQALADLIDEAGIKPSLIVVDTLARCMAGGDENNARDMGEFLASCDKLKNAYGCTVLVVHHSGWEGTHERGSTALPGGVDTRIIVERRGDKIGRFKCLKQKDAEEFGTVWFRMQPLADSLVLDVTQILASEAPIEPDDNEKAILKAIHKLQGAATYNTVKREVCPNPISGGSFGRVITRALRRGFVNHDKDTGIYSLSQSTRHLFPAKLQVVRDEE